MKNSKKLNLISLEKDSLENGQMQSIKGGGVCACRHQNVRRSDGYRRAIVKDEIDKNF